MPDGPATGVPRAPDTPDADAEARDQRIGLVLSGWRLDALLGTGRTARVYAAARQDGVRAAVKVMNPELRGDDRVRRRLFREASLTRRIDLPGTTIVLANDVTPSGEPYVVMERVHGRDLGAALRTSSGPVPARDALAVGAALLEFLVQCHERGVVHRNLAPFNVFLTAEGTVKVLDFGSALVQGELGAQELSALATDLHGYIAPELLASERALGDPRADVWSVGAVLFTALTGYRVGDSAGSAAWRDATPPEPGEGVVRYDAMPLPLDLVAPGLDRDLAALLDRALARDPGGRFASASEMLDAVMAALRTRDTAAAADPDARRDRITRFVRTVYDPRADLTGAHTGAWRSAEVLREIFRLVENVLYAARRHAWHHGETEIRVQHLVEKVLAAVADDEEGLAWTVRPYAFEFRGEEVWHPEPPYDHVTYHLFDAGFRSMRLLPGLGEEECREFLRWLTLDPRVDLPPEDDLATAFWRKAFEHVRSDLVSAVVLQDVDDYERLDVELQAMHADAVDRLRHGIARRLAGHDADDADVPDVDAAKLDYVVSRGSLLDLDPHVMELLDTGAREALPRWRARLAAVVRRALQDASAHGDVGVVLDAWDRFVAEAVDEQRHGDALDVFGSIAELVNDERVMRRLAHPFVDAGRLDAIMEAVVPANARLLYGAELPFLADRLPRLFRWIPEDRTPTVIAALARCSDRTLLGVLLDHVGSNVGGFEAQLGELLATAPPLLGSNILGILAAHPGPDTVQAIERAFASPHAKVRIHAAEVLARYAPLRVLKELRTLVRHTEPQIRQRALEAIEANKLTLAADDLIARMSERGFHQLPIGERRAVMRAACRITSDKGEAALVELLATHGLVANEDLDASRLAAVEVLRDEAMTDDAIESLEAAAKKRWWNSTELRHAATEAIDVVRSRIDELDAHLSSRAAPTGED